MFEILVLTIFIVSALIFIDIHFIGITPIIFFGNKFWNPFNNDVKAIFVLWELTSDCFNSDKKKQSVVKPYRETDSRLAITKNYLLIGKRFLSYHYKINKHDIRRIKLNNKTSKFFGLTKIYEVIMELDTDNYECEILFTVRGITNKNRDKLLDFVEEIRNQVV